MTITMEKVKSLFPNCKMSRIKTVAISLGVKITGNESSD